MRASTRLPPVMAGFATVPPASSPADEELRLRERFWCGPEIQAICREKNSAKNTIDLQWKMRANYNASPCAGEEKTAGAGTMANNRKNNAQSNRNSRTSGRVPTPAWAPEDKATALRDSPPSGMRRFRMASS
jgi:hypothetical protein